MTTFHIGRLVALADEFEEKLDKTVNLVNKDDYNIRFQAQREMLARFFQFFQRRLRTILSQMESDLGTLRERGFDANMRRLMAKVYAHLEEIFKKIDEEKPYFTAQELVDYVGDRHHRSIIDNLEFLAKHQLETTQPEVSGTLPPNVRQIITAESLPMLKDLATKLQQHMEQFPLLTYPIPTPPPPRENPAAQHPGGVASQEEATKV